MIRQMWAAFHAERLWARQAILPLLADTIACRESAYRWTVRAHDLERPPAWLVLPVVFQRGLYRHLPFSRVFIWKKKKKKKNTEIYLRSTNSHLVESRWFCRIVDSRGRDINDGRMYRDLFRISYSYNLGMILIDVSCARYGVRSPGILFIFHRFVFPFLFFPPPFFHLFLFFFFYYSFSDERNLRII